MHEFSLAAEIVEIVVDNAQKADKSKVTAVELEIGELSGVEERALMTALDSLMPNTIMCDAEYSIKRPKGEAQCKECKKAFELSDIFTLCPYCNGFNKDITSGKEFNVRSITAE